MAAQASGWLRSLRPGTPAPSVHYLKCCKVETWPVNVCFSSGIQDFLVGRCCALMFQTIDSKRVQVLFWKMLDYVKNFCFPVFKMCNYGHFQSNGSVPLLQKQVKHLQHLLPRTALSKACVSPSFLSLQMGFIYTAARPSSFLADTALGFSNHC